MFEQYPPNSVVVGIDGSQAAIRAARWAAAEVAGTDIPIRLLYVTQANGTISLTVFPAFSISRFRLPGIGR